MLLDVAGHELKPFCICRTGPDDIGGLCTNLFGIQQKHFPEIAEDVAKIKLKGKRLFTADLDSAQYCFDHFQVLQRIRFYMPELESAVAHDRENIFLLINAVVHSG